MVIGIYFFIIVSQGWAQETNEEKLKRKLHEKVEKLKEEKPKENKKIKEKQKVPIETYLDGKNDGERIAENKNTVLLYGGGAGLLFGPLGYLGYLFIQ